MTTTVQSVLKDVVATLKDPLGIRWPADELVAYFNSGELEVLLHRPDELNKFAALVLVDGTRQKLPTDGAKLIDIPRMTNGGVVRQIDRLILDLMMPTWHTAKKSSTIQHYVYDERDITTFFVYPPANAGVSLDINYCAYPTPIPTPSGKTVSTVTGNMNVPDKYAGAMRDYVLYRAFSKDGEYSDYSARAAAHYQSFASALGIDLQATAAVSPKEGADGQPGAVI